MSISERLLDTMLQRAVSKGTFKLTHAGGRSRTFGTPTPGYPDVVVRFADGKVARDIMLDPRLGIGEAYMDGRVVLEIGDIMQLVSLMRANNRWEDKRKLAPPSLPRKIKGRFSSLARSFNKPSKSKQNVSHHYDIGNDLYRLMLDAEHMQYSCA